MDCLVIFGNFGGKPKIPDFKDFVLDEYILRFEVVVHDRLALEGSISCNKVNHNLNKLPYCKSPLGLLAVLHQVIKSTIITVLHYNIIVLFGLEVPRVNLDDVGRIQVGVLGQRR
jgi:hypothetical protein